MNLLQAHLVTLLQELAHGPEAGAAYGQFSEPGAGLLPTLARLSAAQASVQPAPGRPPLVAAAAHLAQVLTFSAGQLNGDIEFPDFAAPWQRGETDEAGWRDLQTELARAFVAAQGALQGRNLEAEELNVAQSALTHAATHAGAIRVQALNLLAGR